MQLYCISLLRHCKHKHSKMKSISKSTSDLIESNQKVIGRLMVLYNKSSFTISRWIKDKDMKLSAPASLEIIREETGLTDDQILEDGVNAEVS